MFMCKRVHMYAFQGISAYLTSYILCLKLIL